MKRKSFRWLAWLFLALLAIPVICDGLIYFGLARGWQYLYNAAYIVIILPLLSTAGTNHGAAEPDIDRKTWTIHDDDDD